MKLTALLVILATCAAMAAPVFTLSKAKPLQIATSQGATPAEKTAATELRDYIQKLCGAECKITNEKDVHAPAIYLGWTEAARKAVGDLSKLGDEEWVIRTVNGSLILTGGRPRGTLYAVYEFLESLGVVWPDVTTEHVPSMDAITFDAPLSIHGRPAILGRCVYNGFGIASEKVKRFYARNKCNHWYTMPAEYGYGMAIGKPGNCHTFHAYSKPDWPDEWFMMDANGKRIRSTSNAGPGQFCLTNPELRAATVERLKEFIAEDRKGKPADAYPRIYDISHNDNKNHCLCPQCKALAEREGSYSGPLLDFINHIANAVAKDYPEILIQSFAYTWTLDAPKTIKPAKNVMMRVCKLGCEFDPVGKADTLSPNIHPRDKDYYDNFLKWAAISENIAVWDYWILYRKGQFQLPYINYSSVQKDMLCYRDNKVKTMFVESENTLGTSFSCFKRWFGLKLMQNPEATFAELAPRFFKAYYGSAAGPMQQFIEYLQKRENEADFCMGQSTLAAKVLICSSDDMKLPPAVPYLDKEFFEKANSLLDDAERLAADDAECLFHVRKERIPVDIALLGCAFGGELPCGTLVEKNAKALLERFESNFRPQAVWLLDGDIYKKNKELLKQYETEINLIRHCIELGRDSIPEQFRSRPSVFIRSVSNYGDPVFDDESISKYPLKLRQRDTEGFHSLPFTLGVYDYSANRHLINGKLAADDIQQDDKFHWYNLGRTRLSSNSILWTHKSWTLQMPLNGVSYGDDDNRSWDVNVCLKFTGKPYVKDSNEEGNVWMDAILLAK